MLTEIWRGREPQKGHEGDSQVEPVQDGAGQGVQGWSSLPQPAAAAAVSSTTAAPNDCPGEAG